MEQAPTIAISCGDLNGIGLEVALKALERWTNEAFNIHFCGSSTAVETYIKAHNLNDKLFPKLEGISFSEDIQVEGSIAPGISSDNASLFGLRSFNKAIELAKSGAVSAIVTAPINKGAAIKASGQKISGHTSLLTESFPPHNSLMVLSGEKFRVALCSEHIPLKKVAESLDVSLILQKARVLNQFLKDDLQISDPRIAVLGLNPHAGDEGSIGDEEGSIIEPALAKMSEIGIKAFGPFPSDGFFGSLSYVNYDAILAMYHDQGLIPFKTVHFGSGVNITAGLQIVRTSPDHGTAFAIAGKNQANSDSFLQALYMAQTILTNRLS